MTDEERQKLCATLRRMPGMLRHDCIRAANEIERLAAFVQSDAEPVAWQYRVKQGGWGGWHDAVPSREEAELCVELGRKASGGHLDDYEIRPLYTAPPRSDVSAEPVAWSNPAPDAAPSAYSNVKTVTIDCTAPPPPGASAEPVAWREVLEPFAKAADKLEKCRDDRPLWAALDAGWAQREAIPLTVGDLRRARAALME